MNLVENTVGYGNGGLTITHVRVRDATGSDRISYTVGEVTEIEIRARASREVRRPNLGFALNTPAGELVYSISVLNLGGAIDDVDPGEICSAGFRVRLDLMPGTYTLTALAAEMSCSSISDSGIHHDTRQRLGPISVSATTSPAAFDGLVQLAMSVDMQRVPSA